MRKSEWSREAGQRRLSARHIAEMSRNDGRPVGRGIQALCLMPATGLLALPANFDVAAECEMPAGA